MLFHCEIFNNVDFDKIKVSNYSMEYGTTENCTLYTAQYFQAKEF